MTMTRLAMTLALSLLVVSTALSATDAISIHPENPRYFLFRGKPLVLISASEHYGSILNRPFRFETYLDDAAAHKMTMTRTFLLFRELAVPGNPASPCKPASPDYISPFPRTGPGKALDGEAIYDLDHWNPEYFQRLHTFLAAASKRGIVVALTLFSNSYVENEWALNPLRAENNLQHIGSVEWMDYISLKDAELVKRQLSYARKMIDETSGFDNVYYEICNEPGGGFQGHATASDIDQWQETIAREVRGEPAKLHRPHLISGQQAFDYVPKFRFPYDQTYANPLFDIVDVHPLPDTELAGKLYQLGGYQSKATVLPEMARYCRDVSVLKKPTVMDEDNTASMYRDVTSWTIHRKRAWTTVLNGAHYDFIDWSIQIGSETGTAQSREHIRTWMQHLSEVIAGFDVIHATLAPGWVNGMELRNLR